MGYDTNRYYQHKYLMFDDVLGSLDPFVWRNPQREAVRTAVGESVRYAMRKYGLTGGPAEVGWMVQEFTHEIMDFGPITSFLEDPTVHKIVIKGPDEVAIDRLGQMEIPPVSFRDNDHLMSLIRRVADLVGKQLDARVPLLDCPLPDGSRVRAKVPPLTSHLTLTIEKTSGNPFDTIKRPQVRRHSA